eukprot:g983.t1
MTEARLLSTAMSFRSVSRGELVPRLKESFTSYGTWRSGRLPFVYSDHYNTRAFGLQRLHPFDSCKFQKIVKLLVNRGIFTLAELHVPNRLTKEDLMEVHTKAYLHRVENDRFYLCQVVEMPLCFLPTFILKHVFTTSSYYHAAGTILSMGLALEHGWAINIGGGMHHARFDHGEGWCFFADTSLGIKAIRKATGNQINKFLYIDTDVHQGNGVERDKLNTKDNELFVLDVYNADIWPNDTYAKRGIDINVELETGTSDDEYLNRLKIALKDTKKRFRPDMIIYNAGTDILIGDKLGLLRVTPEAVIERDQIIFQFALENQTPIAMLLSGGYTQFTHKVIADSIENLVSKFNLNSPHRLEASIDTC